MIHSILYNNIQLDVEKYIVLRLFFKEDDLSCIKWNNDI